MSNQGASLTAGLLVCGHLWYNGEPESYTMSEGEPANNIPVPQFEQYFPSEADMDRAQRRFYRTWLKHWQAGKPLGVQGNISYLFCYVYTVLALPPEKAAQRLNEIIDGYKTEEKVVEYCERWLSDCYVLMGDCHKA